MNTHLLSIDVDAEMRKLSTGRLRSPHQGPLALVRMSAAAGARHVKMRIGRGRLDLEHDGVPPGIENVEALRILLTREQDDMHRHAALVQLEEAGLLDLLTLFVHGDRQVELDLGPPVAKRLLVTGSGSGPLLRDVQTSRRTAGVSLMSQGGKRNVSAETRELGDAVRFADLLVEVNGKRLNRGLRLDDVLFETRFEKGAIRGVMGIPRKGLAGTTRILRRGILEDEAWTSPEDGAVWEAAVDAPCEMRSRQVRNLVRSEVEKLYDLARVRYPGIGEKEQARVRQLLFRLADGGAGAASVEGVPMFRTVGGEQVSADTLRNSAIGRVVRAVGGSASRSSYTLDGSVFVLDEKERGFVERHLGLIVREPPRRSVRRAGWPGRTWEGIRKALRGAVQAVAAGKEIPRNRLRPDELRFLEAVSEVVRRGWFADETVTAVAFARGRFGGWRRNFRAGQGARLTLARSNPRVKSMVKAFERDPRTLVASLMLLVDGRAPFRQDRGDPVGWVLELTTRSGGHA